jgi:chorismate synthase
MAGNSIGQIFRLTTFGESHGYAIGGVIDGCPPGITIDEKFIEKEMSRRSPAQNVASTSRKEKDKVEFISGLFDGNTTGAPLAFIIKNTDQRSSDYDELKNVFRPSHADFTYFMKYGIRDHRGGGRSSARETAVRVAAGAVSKLILAKYKIRIQAYTSQIGNIAINKKYTDIDVAAIEKDPLRCPDKKISSQMQKLITQLKDEGDTIGGIVSCVIQNCPSGLGEPVFDKLQADLAKAMLSIPAAKGFEYGEGFFSSTMKGSEHNDAFENKKNKITFLSNHSGGIQGGISNGEDIFFNVAFKPVSSISKAQRTVDAKGKETMISIKGRHDICVVPRAVSVVEAMAALVLTDHLLKLKTMK